MKSQGGIVSHMRTEIEVCCLPKDLPEFIEVDISGLSLNESIHLSQLKIPAGVSWWIWRRTMRRSWPSTARVRKSPSRRRQRRRQRRRKVRQRHLRRAAAAAAGSSGDAAKKAEPAKKEDAKKEPAKKDAKK